MPGAGVSAIGEPNTTRGGYIGGIFSKIMNQLADVTDDIPRNVRT